MIWLTRIRSALVTLPMIWLSTGIFASLSILISLFSSTGRTQHRISKVWARTVLWFARVKVEVDGLERIPPGGNFVIIANHRSYFDVPVILPFVPVQIRFLAKKSLFYVPFIGFHLRRAGHIPVNQDSARDSLKSIGAAAQVIK